MRILILGGDGYLGWPTALNMIARGHQVCVVDNMLRRKMAKETDSEPLFNSLPLPERSLKYKELTGNSMRVEIFDCQDYEALSNLVKEFKPETLIHYAEQPSAPYSMRGFSESKLTLSNNINTTFNVIWSCLQYAPDCHIIKLGTMGEYGTPNIDIEEGWLEVDHKGRSQKFLYPRQAGSLYHTTKVLDTDLLWFYVRTYGLRVTDLMQGPVYGLVTPETGINNIFLPNFHYDDIFGTVVNRFLVQAVAGLPLTIFGKGGQTRGYLNINDTLQCVNLAAENPAEPGELKILNQFTETFSVNEIADRIISAADSIGLDVTKKSIENPRKELEDHYYNPAHSKLLDMGLKPTYMTEDLLIEMLKLIRENKEKIQTRRILPRVKWSA